MASFIVQMNHQSPPEEPERPLLTITSQGRSNENLVPKTSKTLNESRVTMMKRLLPQFLILIIPACFIVLGASIAIIDKKAISKAGSVIMQATKLSATLWPIAYAAVVGPMVKAIALHSAERGTTLGTLEVVFASQTLVSTLRGCLGFRIFSLWILAIVAIWTLSPVGGQGVSRAMELQEDRISFEIGIQSFPTNNLSYSGAAFQGISTGVTSHNQWRAVSGAAFLGSDVGLMHSNGSSSNFGQAVQRAGGSSLAIKSSRSDLWRNVRIPFLHLLPGYEKTRPFEWVNVPLDTIPPYESLIGIPIRGLISGEGNGTTTISSYYHYFSCGSWVNQTEWLLEHPTGLFSNYIVNGTIAPYHSIYNGSGFPNMFMDMLNTTGIYYPGTPFEEPTDKRVLVFGTSRRIPGGNITLCEITTSYVDSMVDCTRSSDGEELSCAAKAVRHTKNHPISGNLTAFDVGYTYEMLREIPFIFASLHSGSAQPGILEKFLKDPPSTFAVKPIYDDYDWYYGNLPLDVFSTRFSMLINTFLRASLEMPSLVGMKSMTLDNDTHWLNTTATWEKFTADIYVVKKPWFTLYMASTLVMTVCALINVILRSMTRAPDFLGSVSALTRDSPFVDAPVGGSFMDGTERARLLKDKWVRIQDVKPDEDVGRIAFSDAKGPGCLRMDRQYE